MEPMLDYYFANKSFTKDNIIVKSIDVIGLGESIIEDRIRKMTFSDKDIIQGRNQRSHHPDAHVQIYRLSLHL